MALTFLKETIDEIILLNVVRKREEMSKEEEAKAVEKAKALLEEVAKEVKDGYKVRQEVLVDFSVAEAILNFVEQEEPDLLIMGARGV
ncbi:hypothetical protein EcB171_1987, partial [Escherichia coli B171]